MLFSVGFPQSEIQLNAAGNVNIRYVSVRRGCRMIALIGTRALIGIGALINENTFEGERLFDRGRLLKGER